MVEHPPWREQRRAQPTPTRVCRSRAAEKVCWAWQAMVVYASCGAVELTSTNYKEVVEDSGKSAFVKFFAPWSLPSPLPPFLLYATPRTFVDAVSAARGVAQGTDRDLENDGVKLKGNLGGFDELGENMASRVIIVGEYSILSPDVSWPVSSRLIPPAGAHTSSFLQHQESTNLFCSR